MRRLAPHHIVVETNEQTNKRTLQLDDWDLLREEKEEKEEKKHSS